MTMYAVLLKEGCSNYTDSRIICVCSDMDKAESIRREVFREYTEGTTAFQGLIFDDNGNLSDAKDPKMTVFIGQNKEGLDRWLAGNDLTYDWVEISINPMEINKIKN